METKGSSPALWDLSMQNLLIPMVLMLLNSASIQM